MAGKCLRTRTRPETSQRERRGKRGDQTVKRVKLEWRTLDRIISQRHAAAESLVQFVMPCLCLASGPRSPPISLQSFFPHGISMFRPKLYGFNFG